MPQEKVESECGECCRNKAHNAQWIATVLAKAPKRSIRSRRWCLGSRHSYPSHFMHRTFRLADYPLNRFELLGGFEDWLSSQVTPLALTAMRCESLLPICKRQRLNTAEEWLASEHHSSRSESSSLCPQVV